MIGRHLRDDETDQLRDKKICHGCVRDTYLSRQVRYRGRRAECSYCRETRSAWDLGRVADLVDEVMREHFVRTSTEPDSFEWLMLADKESNYSWYRHGDPVEVVIANLAEIPDEAAGDIQQILAAEFFDYDDAKMGEESEYADGSHYEERIRDHTPLDEEWQEFERTLKTEARFFNNSFARHLASVFDRIDQLKTHAGRPLVVDAGPGTEFTALYRARVFQSDESLQDALARPDLRLGPPPSAKATAGRMNAHGISVFYGAVDWRVAVAEVRPPVGSQVAVARFEILRPLRLLDLTAVSEVAALGSYFDPGFSERLERALFLRSLSARITRPVLPDDEPLEYLSTQAVADFLATEADVKLDGIIFPSAQSPHGPNVVLFQKAARVESIEIPNGTEVKVELGRMYEEGWEREYSVWEEVPASDVPLPEDGNAPSTLYTIPVRAPSAVDEDWRSPTLRIMLQDVKVHVVEKADYKTDPYTVMRHRFPKRDFQPGITDTVDFDD